MIWIIGSSSQYSKLVSSLFDNVKKFGRENIDYNKPFNHFIQQQDSLPDKIFINIKLEEDIAVETDADIDEYKTMFEKFLPIWFWKLKLYTHFYTLGIPCTICEVTSSITHWPQNHRIYMPYASLRAISQQTGFAHGTENLKIFMVSPSNMDNNNVFEYAQKTVGWINSPDECCNKIIDLEHNHIL